MNSSHEIKLELMTKEYERVSTEVREEGGRIVQAYLALGVIISGSLALFSKGWASLIPPIAIFLWSWFMLLLLYQFNRRVSFLSVLESRINQLAGDEFALSFQRFMYSPPNSKQAITKSHLTISSFWAIIMTVAIISVYVIFSVLAFQQIDLTSRITVAVILATLLMILISGYAMLFRHISFEIRALASFYPEATDLSRSTPNKGKNKKKDM